MLGGERILWKRQYFKHFTMGQYYHVHCTDKVIETLNDTLLHKSKDVHLEELALVSSSWDSDHAL